MKEARPRQQALWYTLINYFGVALGIISSLFIYPLDKEFLGLVRYVDSIAQMLFPLMVFGGAQALIHFYPNLTENNKSYLFKYGIVTILSISLILFIGLVLGHFFTDWENYKFLFYAFPLGFVLAFVELFKRQATNIEKLEIPTLYEKIIPKIILPSIFGLLIFGYLNVVSALWTFVGSYFLLLILLIFYMRKYFRPAKGFEFKSLFSQISRKEYYRYSLFSFLGSFGSLLAFRIDAFMIPEFLSFEANGTFNIGVALASSLAIPATGIFLVYAPKVSDYVKNNNMDALGKQYKEIAKLLFFIGAVLYTSVILGIDSLFQMLPTYDKLLDTIPIIMLLGANVLFNMATGFNSEIISYSKYYRFNVISVLILALTNILLNFYFLTQTNLGIIGVAYASIIAMVSFNCFKLAFIYMKFGLLPFDKNYLKLFLLVGISFAIFYFLPEIPNNILNLMLKVGLNAMLVIILAYKLRLVPSLNFWLEKYRNNSL